MAAGESWADFYQRELKPDLKLTEAEIRSIDACYPESEEGGLRIYTNLKTWAYVSYCVLQEETRCDRSEWTNWLSSRELINEAITAAAPPLADKLRAAVAPLDRVFEANTQPTKRPPPWADWFPPAIRDLLSRVPIRYHPEEPYLLRHLQYHDLI